MSNTDSDTELLEALEMCRDLVQEAKGAEGPNGGFVTNHLDDAENWLDRAIASLNTRTPPGDAVERVWQALARHGHLLDNAARDALTAALSTQPNDDAFDEISSRQNIITSVVCDMLWGGEHGWETATEEQFEALLQSVRQRLSATPQPSDGDVERAAAAICERTWIGTPGYAWSNISTEAKEEYRKDARAALSTPAGAVELLREARGSIWELLEPLERASAEMVKEGLHADEHAEAAFDRARVNITRIDTFLSEQKP